MTSFAFEQDDFHRQQHWLHELYDGSMSVIPIKERAALAEGFVAYMDALVEPGEDDWKNITIVQEWAARALYHGDTLLVDLVWQWVEKMIAACRDNLKLQFALGEGFFDDMASHPSDWSNEAENRIRDRIFRYMSDPRTAWVALEAWDDEFESFWPDFKIYLEHPLSANFRGPASRAEIQAIFAERIRRGEEPAT